jgi:hypothetical protein
VRERVAARLVDACNQIKEVPRVRSICASTLVYGGDATRGLPFSPMIMRGFLYLSLTWITAL